MDRILVTIGALSGFVSVATGAFAAHALRRRLAADLLAIFETGSRYQMYHSLALVLAGLVAARVPAARTSGWLFLAGVVLFSGSLYALALSGERRLGAITPLGGLCFLAGWLWLAWTAARS
jgi:uncharacterized membrane protein YgdD (TMEM256/DUF423 family)